MVSLIVISLAYLGIMLICAKIAEEAFRRIGLITFVGPILAGIFLGSGVFNIIKLNDIISFITSLGIIFLLFLAGAEEFEFEGKFSINIFLSLILEASVPFSITVFILYFMHFSNYLILAVPLAMSSAGPLTRMLMDVGLTSSKVGNTIFNQVILVEILFVVLFVIFQDINQLLITIIEVSLVLVFILIFGRFISNILEKIESYFKVREIEFASIITLILILGYFSSIYKFNSAIAAFFLGILLKDYLKDRPELLERLHAFTYGFFEPLFFLGIGLYVSIVNLNIIALSILLFITIISSKILAGFISAKLVDVEPKVNAIATSVKGGVDSSLLLTALTLGYINNLEYSFSILSISISALIIPIIFQKVYNIKIKDTKIKIKLSQEISNLQIKPLYVTCKESLREVISKITERGVRGIVVVNDDMRPLGYISVQTLLEIDPELYEKIKACEITLEEVPIEYERVKVIDILRKFRETERPVIAIVNNKGELITTIYERELMRFLISI